MIKFTDISETKFQCPPLGISTVVGFNLTRDFPRGNNQYNIVDIFGGDLVEKILIVVTESVIHINESDTSINNIDLINV